MQSTPWKFRVVCGLTLLGLTGCQTFSPYGMGGYPGGIYSTPPGGYGPQPGVQFGAPAPTVTPGVPAYSIPGDSQSLRQPPGSIQASQSDAPPFNSGSNTVSQPLNQDEGNLVPDPIHLDSENSNDILPAGAEDESPFGDSEASIIQAGNGPRLASLEDETRTGSDTEFVTPIPTTTDSGNIVTTGGETEQPNPYDYDRKNYQWLRGKIDFDEQDQTWHIIYSLKPDQKDRFGGSITLIDHPDLNKLKNDDVVLLEGKVDTGSLDRTGKVQFRIEKLFGPLVPKMQISTTAGN